MRFFALATRSSDAESLGPAVALKHKPNKLRKLFRKKPRRSPSLSSALSEQFSELQSVSSVENFRVVGHVEEILFGAGEQRTENAEQSSRESTAVDEEEDNAASGKQGGMIVMKRDLFSEKTIYVDALEHMAVLDDQGIERNESMRSMYVDALDHGGEQNVEIKEGMEISVVAEVKEGIVTPRHGVMGLIRDLPVIEEDEAETSFTDISPDEFTPTSQAARKFILLTFIILIATPRTDAPLMIDTRWFLPGHFPFCLSL